MLTLNHIEHSFFAARVLKDVSLSVNEGETVGLVGENGAGKSTLMNIVGGVLRPDGGRMTMSGTDYRPRSPRQAETAGIAFIHQELNLFPNLSVAENLFIHRFPTRWGQVRWGEIHRRAKQRLDQVGLDVSPKRSLGSLATGERQLVEIAKALDQDARLLILDEPTTSLTRRERDRLFDLLDRLRRSGLAMIYISHALDDVRRVCDSVVVLRDGEVVGSGGADSMSVPRMITMMVGRESDQLFPHRTGQASDETLLRTRNLCSISGLQKISFDLYRGEILGIAGLMGSGRTELARAIFGLDPIKDGQIHLLDRSLVGTSVRERINAGMALLTESRRDDGLCMEASIQDNFALVSATRYASGAWRRLQTGNLRRDIDRMRESVQLTPSANSNDAVQTLSGGNQQKVVLGKWLLNQPRLMILDEPTRGIDVGAKFEIYRLIDQLAAGGAGVIMISSELEELMGVCDRMLVMHRGKIADDLRRSEFDESRIMKACFGAETTLTS